MNEYERQAAVLFLKYMANPSLTKEAHELYAKAYKNLMKGVKARPN